jgi:hypothetical protein
MENYSTIVDNNNDTSSTYSTPALSVYSEIGASLDEARPLLTNTTEVSSIYTTTSVLYEEPSATLASASINLSNTILGTGMLAMVIKNEQLRDWAIS